MALDGMIDDYNAFMSELESAIEDALRTNMRKGLTESLGKSAIENVYSYDAQPFFMAQRRYMIADEDNLYGTVDGLTLTLRNMTALRIGEAGEVDIVESGKKWHQPGPRPFMEEGLQEYVSSGRAESDLMDVLLNRGFSVLFG